ncbi:hypothetical protein GIB67_009202 [Kingdonia uniflora]|uniref:Uncharacterized protein n=1 Tax=Kingdonia uniflora TaxID=39325 RepID=A0A7J7N2D7_9MAGN|nr:hypothetical protein GIB67_009202 [Kingdonia uniflora]
MARFMMANVTTEESSDEENMDQIHSSDPYVSGLDSDGGEPESFPGGPERCTILDYYESHRAAEFWKGKTRRAQIFRVIWHVENIKEWPLANEYQNLRSMIESIGFGLVAEACYPQSNKVLVNGLLDSFAGKWRCLEISGYMSVIEGWVSEHFKLPNGLAHTINNAYEDTDPCILKCNPPTKKKGSATDNLEKLRKHLDKCKKEQIIFDPYLAERSTTNAMSKKKSIIHNVLAKLKVAVQVAHIAQYRDIISSAVVTLSGRVTEVVIPEIIQQ